MIMQMKLSMIQLKRSPREGSPAVKDIIVTDGRKESDNVVKNVKKNGDEYADKTPRRTMMVMVTHF